MKAVAKTIVRTHAQGRALRAGEAAARDWLAKPARALDGETPIEHADTEAGAREVENLIGRLEHGVYT